MQERNEPPELDHDRIIEMSATLKHVEAEVENLRTWRHDSVAPVMMTIQAQQKTNAEAIGTLTRNVDRLTESIMPLAGIPLELADHRTSDERSFASINVGLSALHEKMNGARTDLSDKIDENRAESARGHRSVILWIAGMLLAGLAAISGGAWAFIAPHLVVH